MAPPWALPRLNFGGLPPSLQGCAWLGVPPPEDVVVLELAAIAPHEDVPPRRPHRQARVERSRTTTHRVGGVEHLGLVPQLDLAGVRQSLQGYAWLGAPPPEDALAASFVGSRLMPESPIYANENSPARSSRCFNTKSASQAADLTPRMDACKSTTATVLSKGAGPVPKLDLRGVRPSLQGCFGLGFLPPEETLAALPALYAPRRTLAPQDAADREWAIPRLNLWGLPPSLQGWLAAIAASPRWAVPEGSEVAATDGVTTVSQNTPAPLAQPSSPEVPRLNLHGLPPPQTYSLWPMLARLWGTDSPQLTPVQCLVRDVELPTWEWCPGVVGTEGANDANTAVTSNLECAICLADFEMHCLVSRLPCGHIFHGPCIQRWLGAQARCPLCRCPC